MKALGICIWAEFLKIRRSKILWVIAGVFIFFTVLLVTQLAEYDIFKFLGEFLYIFGGLAYGIFGAWIFGREYVNGTATDLLSLPFARTAIVSAKTAAFILTVFMISTGQFILFCLMRLAVSGADSPEITAALFIRHTVLTVMLTALSAPVFFLALCSRGAYTVYLCQY